MDGILLKSIKVNGGHVEYNFHVTGILIPYFTSNTLWIDYQENMEDVPHSILVAPFVASILPLMWVTNTVMWVNEIDRNFYDSIHSVKNAYQRLYYHYPLRGNIIPARFVENNIPFNKEALLLFSGGLDANCSYVRIHDKKPLLFNIQGWYRSLSDIDNAAEADIRDTSNFAKREGCPFSFAKSNFAILVRENLWTKNIRPKFGDSWWHGFQHSMAFITIAIPLAFKHGIEKIYIASSVPMGEFCMCASHVTTDSEFRFADIGMCIHDASELVRQQKVQVVVDYQRKSGKPYPMRVCSFHDRNCCECEKCFRTILGLVAEKADVRDFGFLINKSLKEHWEDVLYRRSGLMSFKSERILHWPYIINRMKENYVGMNQEQKEFVDFFFHCDFDAIQRKSRMRYYRNNFFSIIKRKLKF